MRNKTVRRAVVILFAAMGVMGCQSITARVNRRAEAHVRYEASRHLQCSEKKLRLECTDSYKSGECLEYAVWGCNTTAAYRNLPGDGWTTAE